MTANSNLQTHDSECILKFEKKNPLENSTLVLLLILRQFRRSVQPFRNKVLMLKQVCYTHSCNWSRPTFQTSNDYLCG